MKVAVVLVALFAFGFSAPQPRKLFHEHFLDFLDIVEQEAEEKMGELISHYMEYDEFKAAVEFTRSAEFKDLWSEIESLPEFKDILDFLESDNIDIYFFLDRFHEMLDLTERSVVKRHDHDDDEAHDITAYIRDSVKLLPKDKLAALYDEKMAEDEEFRTAMENLATEEWENIYGALWANEVFMDKVEILKQNGLELKALEEEIIAIFGQNRI